MSMDDKYKVFAKKGDYPEVLGVRVAFPNGDRGLGLFKGNRIVAWSSLNDLAQEMFQGPTMNVPEDLSGKM